MKVLDIDESFHLVIEFDDGKIDSITTSGTINYKLS